MNAAGTTVKRDMGDEGISVRGVRKVFGAEPGGVVALESIDLDIAAGEFVSVVGPSGCGKSTLLRIIGGLTPATSGTVEVFGKSVTRPVTDCGIVFQQPILLDWRTVVQNVLFNIDMRGLDVARYRPRAMELLATVGLTDFADSRPYELSGGMKQRASIARGAGPRAAALDDGRAVRRARCTHPRADAARPGGHLDGHAEDGLLHHSFHRRGGPAVRPRRGDVPAPGDHRDHPGHRHAAAAGFKAREHPAFIEAAQAVTEIFLARGVFSQKPS